MASSGVISGPVITTPYRLPRGTTRLPIGAGAFLQNIVVAGDTFQVQTVGVFTFQVALESAASLGDIPYTVELFNETTGLVEAFSQLVCAASSSAEDQDVVLVTNVVNVAHFYSIRLNRATCPSWVRIRGTTRATLVS
ncbi:MAG: hypothetical protein GZ088_09860 [Acidipila sp.]|nr:hypothetical protein [Acidipila sp.]